MYSTVYTCILLSLPVFYCLDIDIYCESMQRAQEELRRAREALGFAEQVPGQKEIALIIC